MDVEPVVPFEQHRRDEQAVGDRDDRLRGKVDRRVEPLGLENRDAQPLGGDLRGGRLRPPPASARAVRASEHEGELVALGQAFQDVRAERRSRRHADACHVRRGRRARVSA